MVSIIPGMENLAPERTETSSGLWVDPKRVPLTFSRRVKAWAICFCTGAGRRPLFSK